MLLTVIPAVVAGVVSIGLAHLASWLGVGEHETVVVGVLGVMLVGWFVAALRISTERLFRWSSNTPDRHSSRPWAVPDR